MAEQFDPEGRRLPIKLDSTSNGEFLPRPLSAAARLAKQIARQRATQLARRLHQSRRGFLKSSCGAAASLLAMNEAFAHLGMFGGQFDLPGEAALDPALAEAAIGGGEFIFDAQCHHVNPKGPWRRLDNRWTYMLRFFPQSRCGDGRIECFSAEHFLREVFLDSDTDMAVLSAVPAAPEDNPLSTAEAAATRGLAEALDGSRRLMIHGLVHPNLPGAIETMAEQKERYGVVAWKTYTQWGPAGVGFWLDDDRLGVPFIEQARALNVKLICVHKGIPLFNLAYEFSSCRDVGVVARRYPDVKFLIYHSGYDPDRREGTYGAQDADAGVDSLIKSMQDNNVAPNSNVYAELGSTWRMLMRDPEQAAHVLGKLFKYVGEDNVLWGTDSIWYGSPQDQIQAFRTFQIAPELQEKYGYPELTSTLRAKVFGLNAARVYGLSPEEIRKRHARDRVTRIKQAYLTDPEPSFTTNGPCTRREFLRLRALLGGRPA
ncbi:MAG: amidohydrolase family protein [Chromatiales bacterium]